MSYFKNSLALQAFDDRAKALDIPASHHGVGFRSTPIKYADSFIPQLIYGPVPWSYDEKVKYSSGVKV